MDDTLHRVEDSLQFQPEYPLHAIARLFATVVVVSVVGAGQALASPISLTTKLLGDPRPDSPDNLAVNVSVKQDASNLQVTYWTVDLDMTTYHPKARLGEFGFNLVGPGSQYTFSDFNLPYTPVTGLMNGSGNTEFLLTLDDPADKKSDASNVYSLSFTLTKTTSSFTLADFLDAIPSCSSDEILGCNQLAAHLQALGAHGNDSGVAIGNYPGFTAEPGTPNPVPEPGTMLLLGSGVVASVIARRRKKRAN